MSERIFVVRVDIKSETIGQIAVTRGHPVKLRNRSAAPAGHRCLTLSDAAMTDGPAVWSFKKV